MHLLTYNQMLPPQTFQAIIKSTTQNSVSFHSTQWNCLRKSEGADASSHFTPPPPLAYTGQANGIDNPL